MGLLKQALGVKDVQRLKVLASTIPITGAVSPYSNVRIEGGSGKVKFQFRNQTLQAELSVDGELEGVYFVPASFFKLLKSDVFVLTCVDNQMHFDQISIPVLNVKSDIDFLKEWDESDADVVTVTKEKWRHVLPAVSKSDSRRFANGILVDSSAVVSTDGKRLHYAAIPEHMHENVILSTEFVQIGIALDAVQYDLGEHSPRIELDNVRVQGEYVEASFPPYASLFPSDYTENQAVDKEWISQNRAEVELYLTKSMNRVDVQDGIFSATLYQTNSSYEVGELRIKADWLNRDWKFSMNWGWFLDACAAMPEPVLWFKNATSALYFEDGDYMVLLMPVQKGGD